MRAGSKQLIREINQTIVLNAIRTHGALSRTDIAGISKLSLAAISGITAELIELGFVYEHQVGLSTGGRPPVLLALNNQAGYVAGVKLTEDAVIVALTDLEATIVASHTVPLVGRTPEAVAETLAAAVDALRPAARQPPSAWRWYRHRRRDRSAARAGALRHLFRLARLPMAQLLEQRLHIPVVVDNDVNALTAAEQWFGAGRGVDDFLVVSIGRGVGLGMVLNGELYRGTAGGAGEFGHITVVPDGPRCECGKRGCLEALVGDPAVIQRVTSMLGDPVDIQAVIDLALHGDAVVQSIFAAAGRTLGLAIANLVNVLNPALVIIGGEGTRAGALILEPLQEALREHCFNGLYSDMRVVAEPWGDKAWARGAASLLLGELFQPALRRGEEDRPLLAVRSGM